MIEEISEDLYRIRIPLPQHYPTSVNAYVVRDEEKSLIIDAGLRDENCLRTMHAAFNKLGLVSEKTDFFITHGHGDHAGLVPELIAQGTTVFINRLEAEFIKNMGSGVLFSELQKFYQMCGLPEGHFETMIPRIINSTWTDTPPFHFLQEGDIIKRGKYRFVCVETPGHNKGHMCLYEPDRKILIAGDHLLEKAIPPVVGRIDKDNPLKTYLSSLEKTGSLRTDTVLPGHGRPFVNCKQRIQEIRENHREQNRRFLSILGSEPMTIYEVSLRMRHRKESGLTDISTVLQSFLAAEVAFTHLRFLELEGRIQRHIEGQSIKYSLCGGP